ncbi:STAS domain-containing protein [Rossellomorea vietnamensis]|uniref:Anti-sigma factor antagonist n=1 Tax=Rossellomorea vietnamensis TaxID=218284 RepID=A0A5D4MCB9_9BACI|nr:STAS domain-containing protein [Rossellomorea vietnamensis]
MNYSIVEKGNDSLEVWIEGDIDIDSTEEFDEHLVPLMEKHRSVTLSLQDVPFVDSSGIGVLLNTVRNLNDKGIAISIRNVQKEVMEVFELLEIPEILGRNVLG